MTESPSDAQRYLDRPLDGLLEELALYREQATGGPLRSPSDAWNELVPALRKRVCDEWAWCQRRQDARFEEHIALATLVSQIVAPEAQAWQVPAALIAVILVFVLFEIPIGLDWLKGKIETTATEALGRPFSIDGSLAILPSVPPAAQVEGVRIGNPAGWSDADLVRLDLARAGLRILPLLKGEILIEEITVDGLQVNLETNAKGEPNWLIERAADEVEPEPVDTSEVDALADARLGVLLGGSSR